MTVLRHYEPPEPPEVPQDPVVEMYDCEAVRLLGCTSVAGDPLYGCDCPRWPDVVSHECPMCGAEVLT